MSQIFICMCVLTGTVWNLQRIVGTVRIPWDKGIREDVEAAGKRALEWEEYLHRALTQGYPTKKKAVGLWDEKYGEKAQQMYQLKIPDSKYPQVVRADLCTLMNCKPETDGRREFLVEAIDYRGNGSLPEGTPPPPIIGIRHFEKITQYPGMSLTIGERKEVYITIKSTTWTEKNRHEQLDKKVFGIRLKDSRTRCCFQIRVENQTTSSNETKGDRWGKDRGITIVEVKDLKQAFEIETGYEEQNTWIEWVRYSAQMLKKDNCYACASGRPQAHLVPFPLGWEKNRGDMECMMALYQDEKAWGNKNCTTISQMFPPVKQGT